MTTGQIMMKLREIQIDLDVVKARARNGERVRKARETVNDLIEQMLADDRRHAGARNAGNYQPCPRCGVKLYGMEVHDRGDCDNARAAKAHTMGELPFDGQRGKE